jgi:arylsulfatase A-like enzyme
MTEITGRVGIATSHEGNLDYALAPEQTRRPRLSRIAAALSGLALTAASCAPAFAPEAEYSQVAVVDNDSKGVENVLVIVVDDENDFPCADTKNFLPKSSKWLKDGGICFENASVEDPVCCPARSDIMTGQYTQNNGVRRQIDAVNFRAEDSLQSDLDERGFATFGVGKFLNGVDPRDIMSGRFRTGFKQNHFWDEYRYRNYHLYGTDGKAYMPKKDIHTTVRTGQELRSFINQVSQADKPFFAYSAFYAPHSETGGKSSDPSVNNLWPKPTEANKTAPVPPFIFETEENRSDKIALFRHNHIPEHKVRGMNKARIRAMYDVDTQIAKTFETLQTTGELDNTAVFFVSDNGFVLSNWWNGKAVPYRDAWNVPLMMYLPGSPDAGTIDTRNTSLVDIAATAYDVLNVKPSHTVDGHSLLTNFDRKVMFHQFSSEESDLAISESGSQAARVPSWAALETPKGVYVEFYQDRRHHDRVTRKEFYAPNDENQTRNLLYRGFNGQRPSKVLIQRMGKQLHRLKNCAGTDNHSADPCE